MDSSACTATQDGWDGRASWHGPPPPPPVPKEIDIEINLAALGTMTSTSCLLRLSPLASASAATIVPQHVISIAPLDIARVRVARCVAPVCCVLCAVCCVLCAVCWIYVLSLCAVSVCSKCCALIRARFLGGAVTNSGLQA